MRTLPLVLLSWSILCATVAALGQTAPEVPANAPYKDSSVLVEQRVDARGMSLSAAITELVRKARAAESAEPKPPVFERSSAGVPLFPDDGHKVTAVMVRKAEVDSVE